MMRTSRSKLVLAIGAIALFVWLPAAQAYPYLDLTVAGSDGFWNGAYFLQIDPQSTGTGVINSFCRLQAKGTERGYNTNGTPEFDTKGGAHTYAIQLGVVPLVQLPNESDQLTYYREFVLDIDEGKSQSGSQWLSLDDIEIYLAAADDLDSYPSLGMKVYDLTTNPEGTGGENVGIKLNYALDNGNGSGDMLMHIPESNFDGYSDAMYLYLYSQFGLHDISGSGFEEWAVRSATNPPVPPVPIPGAALLVLLGGSLAISFQRRHTI